MASSSQGHRQAQTAHVQSIHYQLDEASSVHYDHFVNYATRLVGDLPLDMIVVFVDNVLTIVQAGEGKDDQDMKHRIEQVLPPQHAHSFIWRGMLLDMDQVDALRSLAEGVLRPPPDAQNLVVVDDD